MDTWHLFWNNMLDSFADFPDKFLSSLFGALFGASCAFIFAERKEKAKKNKEECGAITSAQLALFAQFNTVNNIKTQLLDPLRNNPNREHLIIGFRMTDTPFRVKYDSLTFLLKTDANLLLEIHTAEQSYISAMQCLTWRNEAYNKFHENSTVKEVDMKTGKMTAEFKDPRNIMLLKNTTDHLYNAIDTASERLVKQAEELFKVGKKLFPKENFLKHGGMKPLPTAAPVESAKV